jgi:hypothetical protein
MALKYDFLHYNNIWYIEEQSSHDFYLNENYSKRNIDANDGLLRLEIYIFPACSSFS